MKERPCLHKAYDRRCYDGAPCTDLKRERDSLDKLRQELLAVESKFRTVYFPVEEKYSGWIKYEEITGMHYELGDCLLEAWDKLVGEKDEQRS